MQSPPAPSNSSPVPSTSTSKQPLWKVSPANGKYYINSVAVSADGGTVLGGTFCHNYGSAPSARKSATIADRKKMASSDDGTYGIYCYNGDGSTRWADEFTAWEGVYWVAVSQNGKRAAGGGNWSQSPHSGFIRAYDATTGKVLLHFPTQQRVNQVALSADGDWLVAGAECVFLFHYNSQTGAYDHVASYTPDSSTDNDVVSVGISADGASIVFSDYDGHVGLLENADQNLALLKQYTMTESFCHMLSFAPDGQAFAAGGSAGQFHLFHRAAFLASGQPTYTYDTGVKNAVYGVAVSSNGQVFAGVVNNGADSGYAYIVTVASGEPSLRGKVTTNRNPNCIALNLDHGYAAIADGHPDGTPGNFYLYAGVVASPASEIVPTLQWEYTTDNMSWPIAIAAGGGAIVGGSDDSFIYYFTPTPA